MSALSKEQLKSLILKEMSLMKRKLNEGPQEDQEASAENDKMLSTLNKLIEDFTKATQQQMRDLQKLGHDPSTALDKANVVINMMSTFSQYHQQIQPLADQLNQMQQQQMQQMAQAQGAGE